MSTFTYVRRSKKPPQLVVDGKPVADDVDVTIRAYGLAEALEGMFSQGLEQGQVIRVGELHASYQKGLEEGRRTRHKTYFVEEAVEGGTSITVTQEYVEPVKESR